MLEHLKGDNGDYEPPVLPHSKKAVKVVDKATAKELADAQMKTVDWLDQFGVDDEEVVQEAQQTSARGAFQALTTQQTPEEQRKALMQMNTPQAVRHLTGMLAAYDWQFIEQAKELRGFAVAKILEEVDHPDAKVRLKALEMLGKVTEVALFTDRVEVKKADMSDLELEAKIKEKLGKFMGVVDVDDVTDIDPDDPDEENLDKDEK